VEIYVGLRSRAASKMKKSNPKNLVRPGPMRRPAAEMAPNPVKNPRSVLDAYVIEIRLVGLRSRLTNKDINAELVRTILHEAERRGNMISIQITCREAHSLPKNHKFSPR